MSTQTLSQTSSPTAAKTDSEALAQDIRTGVLKGFIGHGIAFNGEIAFQGMLRIDGHFTGFASSEDGTLVVSAGAILDADVETAVAVINGTVKGDIIAVKSVEIHRGARVVGDIHTPALVIEEGAIFEGSCRMTGQASSKQAAKRKLREYTLKQTAGK